MQTTVRHSFLLTKRFPLDCFANNSVTKRLWNNGWPEAKEFLQGIISSGSDFSA